MATKLKKVVERELEVPGIARPVIVSIAPNGVTAHVKGSKAKVFGNWERVLGVMLTSEDVPSHLFGKPLELLRAKGRK